MLEISLKTLSQFGRPAIVRVFRPVIRSLFDWSTDYTFFTHSPTTFWCNSSRASWSPTAFISVFCRAEVMYICMSRNLVSKVSDCQSENSSIKLQNVKPYNCTRNAMTNFPLKFVITFVTQQIQYIHIREVGLWHFSTLLFTFPSPLPALLALSPAGKATRQTWANVIIGRCEIRISVLPFKAALFSVDPKEVNLPQVHHLKIGVIKGRVSWNGSFGPKTGPNLQVLGL